MFFEKGRMGSANVWGLSFRTIVFLGIWEAAKNMSRPLKLAPLQTSLKHVRRSAHNAASQIPRTTMNLQIRPQTLALPMLTIG